MFSRGSVTAKETMFCWKPGTADVKLIRWPDSIGKSRGYYTSLACFCDVQEMSFALRKAQIFIDAMHAIVRDKCDPLAVHNALLGLKEYCDGCHGSMPGMVGYREEEGW